MFSKVQQTPRHDCYEIQQALRSGPSVLLFARNVQTNEDAVIKVLQKYKDTRYKLETIEARQQCQLKALIRNRRFTPGADIYIGLGGICEQNEEKICFAEIIGKKPSQRKIHLERGVEYALLMKPLADERRLDLLLQAENDQEEEHLISSLVAYIVYMHRHLARRITPIEKWGSTDYLYKKLEHNIGLFELVKSMDKDQRYRKYYRLKDELLRLFDQRRYQAYFEEREQKRYIRRCHGDLRASNIWIDPYNQCWSEEQWKHVHVLDAIDFNPMYSNIDILSDFAMLIVDMEPQTRSLSMIDRLIKDYLEQTEQEDRVSRSVLAYYLMEKALVRAAISIVYDDQPEIGLNYLQMVERFKEGLKDNLIII